MCRAPKATPGFKKIKIRKGKMNCENCTINITLTKLDYVECETCPIVVCARCDMNTKLMTVEEDCVIRCRLCYEQYLKVDDNVYVPRSPVAGLADPHQNLNRPGRVLDSGNEILYESYNTLSVK